MNGAADLLGRKVSKIYFDDMPLDEKDLQKSRTISIFEGCTARTVVTLCGGPFLAGLAGYLGANDQINGIIGAVPTLAGIIMLFSPIVLEGLSRRKLIITFFAFLSRVLLSLMFFIPLLVKGSIISVYLLGIMFLAANLLVSFITPAASNWIISITPGPIRGRYFGVRESFVLGFVTVAALIMGRSLDHFKRLGYEKSGFIIIFATTFIFAIVNFALGSIIKEPKVKLADEKISVKDLFKLPMGNRVFRKIILLFIFWNTGFQFGAPFTAVYMVSGLKLNYTFITVCAFLASSASVAGARVLGRLADKRSWLSLMIICLSFQVASMLVWFFVNGRTVLFLTPLAQLLGGVAVGGINITLSNIQYQFAPLESKTVYIGFSSAIGGLAGFLSSLLGAAFVGYNGKLVLRIFDFEIGNMQLVFAASGLILISCIVFVSYIRNRMYG